MYKASVAYASRELTARERIQIKDTADAISLDVATAGATAAAPLLIDYAFHAVISIHNDKADNKDYQHLVIVDTAGTKFYTGSDSFRRALEDIIDELTEEGSYNTDDDTVTLKIFRKPSNNYTGKEFITGCLA